MASIEPPRTPNLPPEIVPLRARQFRVPKTLSALRHRNYRLFISGQLVSLAGTWMQTIAQGWLVYEISGSELALGIVGFASAVPVLLMAPWAGVIVDQIDKRNLLVMTQSGAMLLALILAVLAFGEWVAVWHVVLLAAGLGLVNSFDGPARQAFVVEMVGQEDLPNAIALNSMTFNSARIFGPALGGGLLVAFGPAWCFLLNGLTFLAVIRSLLMMKFSPREIKRNGLSPWQQMRSGVAYVRDEPNLRTLLLMALVFSLFGVSYSTILPAFVDKVLHAGAGAFGVINAFSGVGAVTGAFIIARYGDRGKRGRWLTWALLAFPIILTLFAVIPFYPAAMVLSVALGINFMIVFTLINTLLQTNLADGMRGRVLSLYTLTFFGFTPFGNLFIGSMSEAIGLSPAMVISAVLCLGLSALLVVKTPSIAVLR